jgi:hypothetical protein
MVKTNWKKIGPVKYFRDVDKAMNNTLFWNLSFQRCDAIVCLKRSGFLMGAYLSNKMGRPLFAFGEIKSIPAKFRNILVCDDKVWRGRQLRHAEKKLRSMGKSVQTLCLYVEANAYPDFWVERVGKKVKLFYER